MRDGSIALILAGIALAIGSFLMGNTVETYSASTYLPDRVVNLGKMQLQTLVFASGAVLFLSGIIFSAAHAIILRLEVLSLAADLSAPEPAATAAPQRTPEVPQLSEEELDELRRQDRRSLFRILGAFSVIVVILAVAVWLKASSAPADALDVVPAENVTVDTMVTNIDAADSHQTER